MSYEPRAHGALCDECPLRGLTVVPPTGPEDAVVAFIAEAPGEREEEHGEPLVGPAGRVFNEALEDAGLQRKDVWITNTVLCRPRDENGKNCAPPDAAVAACAPRLRQELVHIRTLVPMGAVALHGVCPGVFVSPSGRGRGITSVRGYLQKLDDGRAVLPTVHPAFLFRQPTYAPAFKKDLQKVAGIIDGSVVAWRPFGRAARTVSDVVGFFEHTNDKPVVIDVETSRDHPMKARLNCIGFSCAGGCCVFARNPVNLVIPLLADGQEYWTSADKELVIGEIKRALKVGDDWAVAAGIR